MQQGGWRPSPAARLAEKKTGVPHFAFREVGRQTVNTKGARFYAAGGRIFIVSTSHSFTLTGPASPSA